MNTSTSFNLPSSVLNQIVNLPDMKIDALRKLWKQLIGGAPPNSNRPFLERRLAYKLQEIEYRKFDRNLLDNNKRRLRTLMERGKLNKRSCDYQLTPGSILMRLYQDVEHQVVVLPEAQFEYRGKRYGSLSMIAREITGTQWSGPLFFGLKQKASDKKKLKGASSE
jgi:hypothetical protein